MLAALVALPVTNNENADRLRTLTEVESKGK